MVPTAAMLWSCAFRLPSGRTFQPFARAPWAIDPRSEPEPALQALPGHIRRLGGEFVCMPFGDDAPGQPMHGWAADAEWRVVTATNTNITFRIDYPADDDVAFLLRHVAVVPTEAALDLSLSIHVRRDCERTLALHPVLRLPEPPALLHVTADFDLGMTWPDPVAGTSGLRPGARFTSLRAVPRSDGRAADFSALDLTLPQEELLQLCGASGCVAVTYPSELARCVLTWDRASLPSCMIWISDRKLTTPPWSGQFRGLGIEPAPASLAPPASVAANGCASAQSAGCTDKIKLTAQTPTVIRYRIAGEDAG